MNMEVQTEGLQAAKTYIEERYAFDKSADKKL